MISNVAQKTVKKLSVDDEALTVNRGCDAIMTLQNDVPSLEANIVPVDL